MAIDPGYGVNNFGGPKLYTESETLVNNILVTLFGKPGAYPTMPDFGMYLQGIIIRMEDEFDEDAVKTQLVASCSQFSEVVQNGEFSVKRTSGKLKSGTTVPFILLSVPTLIEKEYRNLRIGVGYDGKQIVYNYSWIKSDLSGGSIPTL